MDPQFKPPLTFAEQLRALQEHHSTCLVKITDGTLNGEIHLLNGNVVSSHYGVLDGQAAVDAVLAAGANIEYVVSSRSETPDDDESMVVPVITWHDPSTDITPVDFMREDEVTRHLAMAADHDSDGDAREVHEDRLTPVAPPSTQPGWGPKAAPTGAFATPRKRQRLAESAIVSRDPERHAQLNEQSEPSQPSMAAASRRSVESSPNALRQSQRSIDSSEPTEPKATKRPPALPKRSANSRLLIASAAVIAAILLVFWARSRESSKTSTSTSAATDTLREGGNVQTVLAPVPPVPTGNVAETARGAASPTPRTVASGSVASGSIPETPGGALAPTIPVRVHVSADGHVTETELVAPREGFASLEQQALDAARSYRFQPQQKGGKPSDAWLTVPMHFRPTPPDKKVYVKGEDSIGEPLVRAWASALQEKEPHVKVQIDTLGSTTGMAALLDGSADLAVSTRLVRTDELALAERLDMQLREVFIGYDAIAIIVHPDNPIASIDMDTLAAIYTERVTSWSEIGGSNAPIRVFGRPGYSGTNRIFKDRVLSRLGPDTLFTPGVENIERTADVLAAVAANPNSIGFVSMGMLTSAVRAVPLASQHGGDATPANVDTVRDGSYALAHPLVVYLRPDSGPAAHKLVDFAISSEGQAIVAQKGFVSLPGNLPLVAADASAEPTPPPSAQVIRIYFDPSSARIARDSQADILTAVAAVRARRPVVVVGNADSTGTARENQVLAQRRAEAVAQQLRELGSRHASIAVQVASADHPLGSNETSEGRRLNRRVDVIVQAPTR